MFIWFIVAGLVSGIIAGMGMGGGTLLIPVLTIFLGVGQKVAQATNLVAFIPTSIVALIIHFKNKLVDFKAGLPIIISGVIFSIVGSLIANILPNEVLKIYFGIFLLLVGVWIVVQTIFFRDCSNKNKKPKIQFGYTIFIKK